MSSGGYRLSFGFSISNTKLVKLDQTISDHFKLGQRISQMSSMDENCGRVGTTVLAVGNYHLSSVFSVRKISNLA